MSSSKTHSPVNLGRYVLFDEIASGGMATVHFARMTGAEGFSRVVAIKRLHPQHAKDAAFRGMFVDEARIASRIRHPNVVVPLDVVATDSEVFLVMEYVHASPLSNLAEAARKRGQRVPLSITVSVMGEALRGLHAAHTAVDIAGVPLRIIHRDISPHNILVGADGATRLIDFGVAKAAAQSQSTQDGHIKGKLAYMAPEQLLGVDVTPRADIYAMGIVLWELIVGQRMFEGEEPASLYFKVMNGQVRSPRALYTDINPELEAVIMRALSKDASVRFETAVAMATALEAVAAPSTSSAVAEWVDELAGASLAKHANVFRRVENETLPAVSGVQGSEESATGPQLLQPPAAGLPPLRGPLDGTLASVGQAPLLAPAVPQAAPIFVPKAGRSLGGAAVALGLLMCGSLGYVWGWPAFLMAKATMSAAAMGYVLKASSASGTPSHLRLSDVDLSLMSNFAISMHAARMDVLRAGDTVSDVAVEGGALSLVGPWPGPNQNNPVLDSLHLSYQGRVEWENAFGQQTKLTIGAVKLERKAGVIVEARLSALRVATPSVSLGPWMLQRESSEQGRTDSLWLDPSNLRPSITCALQASSERCDVQVNRSGIGALGVVPMGLGVQSLLLQPGLQLALSGHWVSHEKGAEGVLDGGLDGLGVLGGRGSAAVHAVIAHSKAQLSVVWPQVNASGLVALGDGQWTADLDMTTLVGKKQQHTALMARVPLLDLASSTFVARFPSH